MSLETHQINFLNRPDWDTIQEHTLPPTFYFASSKMKGRLQKGNQERIISKIQSLRSLLVKDLQDVNCNYHMTLGVLVAQQLVRI